MDPFEKVKEIIVSTFHLGAPEAASITMDTRFREDLEADSLDLVELIMAFEDAFEQELGRAVTISDDDAKDIKTVGQAVAFLKKQMEA